MLRKLSLSATVLAAAILAGRSADAVDPSRTQPGAPTVPSPLDIYGNPYTSTGGTLIPGTSIYSGTSLPISLQPDLRGRGLDPISTIPGTGSLSTTVTPYIAPGTTVPAQPPTQNRWRLGVYSKDTDTGVRISQVVSGSAAQRAGLEANDTIVCVSGYQVGYVNGSLYDCAHEFERNVSADGWVTLLVENGRDGRLVNLPVQLESRYNRIDGNITYREYYSLPRDAVATVELRETLRPGAPAVTIARKQVTGITNTPIPFSVDFDPSLVDPRRTYNLTATITSGNRTLFATRRTFAVLNGQPNTNVALLVEGTGTATPGNPYANRDQQIEQIVAWFRDYLHRDPRALELAAWQSHIDRGGSLNDAQVQILSMPEYYNRADANDVTYIRQLHEQILGKQPTQEELAYWLNRMQANNRLRPEVAKEFLAAVGVQR
jgi:uncharacterized lipoprotein YbaY